uniref:Uncharacterized protein n=1 Tax=Candidatus Kentrum sp. LFY TaxID=2126342 RepID=A0A450V7P3_9GAMM|nr:MAG: hypothetical protein BECKLFY1418B_GA0070995_12111 [Candidatus Kentron sp. LFY]
MRLQCFGQPRNVAYAEAPIYYKLGDTSRTPTCLAPPPPSVALRRWLHTPPSGEFEQVVLYRYGPAQVGLGQSFTPCG